MPRIARLARHITCNGISLIVGIGLLFGPFSSYARANTPSPGQPLSASSLSFQDILDNRANDTLTKAEKQAFLNGLPGKQVVDWQGRISDVSSFLGSHSVWVDLPGGSTLDAVFSIDKDAVGRFSNEQSITISGRIERVNTFLSFSIRLEDVVFELGDAPTPVPTSTPRPTRTPKPTNTSRPSRTPRPTDTPSPTRTSRPTATQATPTPEMTYVEDIPADILLEVGSTFTTTIDGVPVGITLIGYEPTQVASLRTSSYRHFQTEFLLRNLGDKDLTFEPASVFLGANDGGFRLSRGGKAWVTTEGDVSIPSGSQSSLILEWSTRKYNTIDGKTADETVFIVVNAVISEGLQVVLNEDIAVFRIYFPEINYH